MDKNELIVKQQLEIERLKLDIKNIKKELIPLSNRAIHLQQYSVTNNTFPTMGMNLAIQCSRVLSDIVHEN